MSKVPNHILDYLIDEKAQVWPIPKRQNNFVLVPRRSGKALRLKKYQSIISGIACLVFIGVIYRAIEIYQMLGAQ